MVFLLGSITPSKIFSCTCWKRAMAAYPRRTGWCVGQPAVEESRTAEYFAPIERRTLERSAGEIWSSLLLYGHTTSKSRPVCGKTAAKSSLPV
jgi:hypothetical protein